jgi:hypothetical protein
MSADSSPSRGPDAAAAAAASERERSATSPPQGMGGRSAAGKKAVKSHRAPLARSEGFDSDDESNARSASGRGTPLHVAIAPLHRSARLT